MAETAGMAAAEKKPMERRAAAATANDSGAGTELARPVAAVASDQSSRPTISTLIQDTQTCLVYQARIGLQPILRTTAAM